MRLFPLVAIIIDLLVVGCSHPTATSHRESGVLLLDNRGGFAYAGRRIALQPDGSYTDTTYSDVIGKETSSTGHYTLNQERTHLILSPQSGAAEHLYNAVHRGKQYWVHEADRERIAQRSGSWLRQISVKVVP